MSRLDVVDLGYRYPDAETDALTGISFTAATGSFTAVIGACEAGKSSLLMALNGVVPQLTEGRLAGRVLLDGADLADYRVQTISAQVGLVLQDPSSQLLGRTVAENVAFGPRNHLVPAAQIPVRVAEALARVGLAGFEDRVCDELSGGEQQRLAIAGVLAMRPELLCLDEPTAQLDPDGAAELLDALAELRASGMTIVAATQEPKLAAAADQLLVLQDGTLVWRGEPSDFYASAGLAARFGVLPLAESADPRPPRPVRPDAPAAVRVHGLSHTYPNGTTALADVDLEIPAGTCFALLGRNGAGKTTLVKHLNNLLPTTSGTVELLGEPIADVPTWQLAARIGYVFQNPDHQLFCRTVAEEAGYALKVAGRPAAEVDAAVASALELTGLTELAGRHPRSLPLSVRQRVAVAAAVAPRPPVLVFDEPTTGQDAAGIAAMVQLVERLLASGTTVILISHDLPFVSRVADSCAVLADGAVVRQGPAAEVITDLHPLHLPAPAASDHPDASDNPNSPDAPVAPDAPAAPVAPRRPRSGFAALDLRARLILFVAMLIAVGLAGHPAVAAALVVVQLLVLGLGGVRLDRAVGVLRPLVVVLLLIIPATAIGTGGFSPAYSAAIPLGGGLELSLGGALVGLTMVLRIIAMALATAALALTTDLDEVLVLLDTVRAPGWLAMLVTTTLSLIPGLTRTQQQIQQAQQARGARPPRGGPIGQVIAWVPMMVPLIAHSLGLADQLAVALTSRGYGAHRRITVLSRLTWRAPDTVGVLIAVAGLAALGWLRFGLGVVIR